MHPSLRALLVTVLAAMWLPACADGGGGPGDGAPNDEDGGARRDAGHRDGGSTTCTSGQHRCGGGCIDDLANDPANGCQFGCGEPCPTPPDGMAACSAEGLCTFACPPPFHQEGDACVCTPRTCTDLGYMCGAPDDGCGTPLDCGACGDGAECIDGTCGCPADDAESNDSSDTATPMGNLSDSPSTDATLDTFTIDASTDHDWYSFNVADNTDCCTSTNPDITVTLDRIPTGSNYDLAAYYVCDATRDHQTSCGSGAPDTMIGAGCSSASSGTTSETVVLNTECGGTTNEDGKLLIHVIPRTFGGSCAAYRLRIHVE